MSAKSVVCTSSFVERKQRFDFHVALQESKYCRRGSAIGIGGSMRYLFHCFLVRIFKCCNRSEQPDIVIYILYNLGLVAKGNTGQDENHLQQS